MRMRFAFVLLEATGCGLLFPLEDRAAQPEVMLQTGDPEILAATPTTLDLTVAGQDNATVFFEFTANQGALDLEQSSLALDDAGFGNLTVGWTPPDDYTFATVTTIGSYDSRLQPPSSVESLDVRVLKRIGNIDLPFSDNPPDRNTVIAAPVQFGPTMGDLVEIGVTFTLVGSNTMAMLGLYGDDDGSPTELLFATPPFPISNDQLFVQRPVDPELRLSPGSYWLAFISDEFVGIDADAVNGLPSFNAGVGSLSLPTTFPSIRNSENVRWSFHATIAPVPK